jgi:phage terminase large subunit-like protein
MNELQVAKEFSGLLEQLERRKQIYRLEYYKPYPKQMEFHNSFGHRTQQPSVQKAFIAANKIGKTYCGAMEISMHATGRYPEWFKGVRFPRAVEILVGSNTNETLRDICQKELLGDPTDDKRLGTGTIPIDTIGKVTRKAGVPNSLDSVRVKHVSGGWSRIYMRAYEQGFKKFMGIHFDVGWADEEPPLDIWSQMLRATFAKRTSVLMMTLTPEEGMTQVVAQFMNDLKLGQAIVNATWDDAPHMTPEVREQRLAAMPPHEREMRTKGVPLMGSGLVFDIPENELVVEPIAIPRHWPQIIGIDFGWDHPFGAAKLAWDRDADIVYITADYRESKAVPAIHAAAIKPWGSWIPVAWPHDGLNTEKGGGETLIQLYREEGIPCLKDKATNPASPGKIDGQGDNAVEPPLLDMVERSQTGRLKVFKTCRHWLEEKRMYHRKEGKLVKQNDDVISASRYAYMMLRFAITEPVRTVHRSRQGMRTWT